MLNNLILQLLGIIIAIVGVTYIYLKNVTYGYWISKGVPQVEAVVPFGCLWPVLSAKKSIGEFMRDQYLRFRETRMFGIYSFHRPSLVVCDPDLIRFILTKEFSHFHDRGLYCNEKIDPLLGHIFLISGIKWRNLRTKLTPTFTSGKMKQMFGTVKECSVNLSQYVTQEIEKNRLIEVKDMMARFTTDVIASVAFGIECNSLKNPDAEFRRWGRKVFEPRPIKNTLILMYPRLLDLCNVRVTDKGTSDFFIKAFKETVEYRTANNVVRHDFMELLMQLMNNGYVQGDEEKDAVDQTPENTNGKLTMLEGAAEAFVFWVAGFETSSTAATHCLYELALNLEIQEKLATEINRVLSEFGGLTYESLNAMSYLHKVVNETLRKYPSLPILNRECTKDCELPGTSLRVTKGTAIVVPVLGLHFDPQIYPEPEKFDPERFSEENIAGRHRYAYLPFGEGPRNCIGMRFGLIQTKIGIATIISKYRIQPGPGIEVPLPVDKGNVLHGPKGEVNLLFEER